MDSQFPEPGLLPGSDLGVPMEEEAPVSDEGPTLETLSRQIGDLTQLIRDQTSGKGCLVRATENELLAASIGDPFLVLIKNEQHVYRYEPTKLAAKELPLFVFQSLATGRMLAARPATKDVFSVYVRRRPRSKSEDRRMPTKSDTVPSSTKSR